MIKWVTYQIYVDLETGEVLPHYDSKYYTIIHKEKETYVRDEKKTWDRRWGKITYIYYCRRISQQGQLFKTGNK